MIRIVVELAVVAALHAGQGGLAGTQDSAGVRIIQARVPAVRWSVSAQPELRIGVVEGEEAHELSQVRFAARRSDGGVVVANNASSELRFYDSNGKYIGSVGRRGAGPGEFRNIWNVMLTPGDSVLVHDAQNRRLTVVTPGRTIAREHSLTAFQSVDFSSGSMVGTLADGRVVIVQAASRQPPITQRAQYMRDTIAIIAASFDGSRVDTIVRVPGQESSIQAGTAGSVRLRSGAPRPTTGGGWTQRGVPFSYAAYYALVGDRLLFALSERPDLFQAAIAPDRPECATRRASEGTCRSGVVRITRQPDFKPVLVSSVRDKYESWVVDLAKKSGNYDPETGQRVRATIDLLPRGHTVPVLDKLLADAAGRIWIRDAAPQWMPEGPQQWTVYATDGRIIARATTPLGFNVMHIGQDHITGVTRDDLNVECVRVYRILR
jgi:hypothetical protein